VPKEKYVDTVWMHKIHQRVNTLYKYIKIDTIYKEIRFFRLYSSPFNCILKQI